MVGLRYGCNCSDGSFNRVEDIKVRHTGIWPHMCAPAELASMPPQQIAQGGLSLAAGSLTWFFFSFNGS